MKKRQVVITGMGAITPIGNTAKDFWEALIVGKSGIKTITSFDTTGSTVSIAGELKEFNPENSMTPQQLRKLDRFSVLSLISAEEAIESAGLNLEDLNAENIGVMLGTGVGGIGTLEEQHQIYLNKGFRRVSPQFVPKMIANIAAGQIAIKFGLQGPNQTIVSACASGTDAIGLAMRLIRYGDADVMIAGGAEASITPLTIAGFANMKALSTRNDSPEEASRPFDLDRDGFVMGEGAGFLVLESLEHAQQRGATILAELAGYGATDDAYHITQPAEGGAGAVKAMKKALTDADLQPENIQYINAHGTSTPFNDKNESLAINTVFGKHTESLLVSSSKSMTGHLLGASGAIEAVASVKSIQNNMAPPTINYTTPDPNCVLNYVPNQPINANIDAILSNSFGFGGHNGVLCIKKWSGN